MGLGAASANFLIFCVEVSYFHFHICYIFIIVIDFQKFHVHTCIKYLGGQVYWCMRTCILRFLYIHASLYIYTHADATPVHIQRVRACIYRGMHVCKHGYMYASIHKGVKA